MVRLLKEVKDLNIKMKVILILLCNTAFCNAENKIDSLFNASLQKVWKEVFNDDFTDDWNKQWFKDGEKSTLQITPDGLKYCTGKVAVDAPQKFKDLNHEVLWTKKKFSGDIRIEYDYTRLDTSTHFASMIYLFAEGSGVGPYKKEITQWNELRKIPKMNIYFNHMNLYHISYASFGIGADRREYIRARRYMPEKNGLTGTIMENEYFETGFFYTGEKHHITIVREGKYLFMRVSNKEKSCLYNWDTSQFPPVKSGHIGLRLMCSRAALINNFQIFTKE